MADFFTDEDLFGTPAATPPPPRPPTAAPAGPKMLSDADLFGSAAAPPPAQRQLRVPGVAGAPTGFTTNPLFDREFPTTRPATPEPVTSLVRPNPFTPFGLPASRPAFVPPTPEDALRGGVKVTGEALGNLLTRPRETLGLAGKEFTSLFDLATTGVMQAVGTVFGESIGRTVAAGQGASRDEAIAFGKEFGQSVVDNPALNQPLSRLYAWAIKQPGVSTIDQAMEKMTEMIDKGGEAAQEESGGAIRAGDVSLLANALFAGIGGNVLGGRKFFENYRRKPGAPAPVEPTFDPGPRYITTPSGRIINLDASTPAGRARADVEASTGVTDAAAAAADRVNRRKQARAAFKEDPEYADYLRNFAEEEAKQRAQQVPLTAPGGLPYSGPRTPRVRGEAPEEPGLPPARTPPIEAGPTPLDSALAKLRAGQRFLLTPEEKIALRGSGSSFGRPNIEGGHASQRFLSMIGKLGLGAALAGWAYHENDPLLGLAGILGMTTVGGGKGRTLGEILAPSSYTTGMLEALPKDKTFFTQKDIGRAAGSQGITAVEKQLFADALGGRKQISADELMQKLGERLNEQQFEPVEYRGPGSFDEYGLARINRAEPGETVRAQNISDPAARQAAYQQERLRTGHDPVTTILQSTQPVPHYRPHFHAFPRAFAHVRSFMEDGIRHIVELQSDAMQKLKVKTREEIAGELPEVEQASKAREAAANATYSVSNERLVEKIDKFKDVLTPEEYAAAKRRMGKLLMDKGHPNLFASEQWHNAYMAGRFRAIYDSLLKTLRESPDSVNREAVARAFQAAFRDEKEVWQEKVNDFHARQVGKGIPAETMKEIPTNFPKRLVREAIALFPNQTLRLATADTVAKVEGWTDLNHFERLAAQGAIDHYQRLAGHYGSNVPEWVRMGIEQSQQRLAAAARPNYGSRQGIYNRYAGEIERFLKSEFKARPHTDAHGHTWLEVDPQAPGRIRMLGKATPEALIALGLGTTAGLALYSHPEVKKALKEMDLGTLMAVGLGVGSLPVVARGSKGGRPSLYRQRGMLGEGDPTGKISLGSILRNEDLTLKIFESLSPRAHTFTRKQIEDQLARQDVVKPEKDLIREALGDKTEISASDLVAPFLKRAREHALYKTETGQYDDYGFERINRTTDQSAAHRWIPDGATPEEEAQIRAEAEAAVVDAHTTLFKLNDPLNLENHFNDPRYFAHDRHFTDHAGIDHVVETQSDIVQKQEIVPDAVIREGRAKIQAAENTHNAAAAAESNFRWNNPNIESLNRFEQVFPRSELLNVKERIGQILWNWVERARFPADIHSASMSGDKVAVYNYAKQRLEELIRDGTDRMAIDDFHNAFASGMRNEVYTLGDALYQVTEAYKGGIPESYAPMVKNWFKRIVRERVAESADGRPVRYATADTVAKVEGWPEHHMIDEQTLQNARDTLAQAEAALARAEAAGDRYQAAVEQNEVNYWKAHIRDQLLHNDVDAAAASYLEAYKQRLEGEANTPEKRAKIPQQVETARASMAVAKKAGHLFRNPDHANIYARYAKELNPWIEREFKTKPYTDPLGHTWIEIPARPAGAHRRVQMYGRASLNDMATLAAFTGGAMAMHAYADDPNLVKDFAAGMAAAAGTRVSPRSLVGALRLAKNSRPSESVGEAAKFRVANMQLGATDTANTVREASKLVPSEAGMEKVNTALDTGKTADLTPQEKKAYDMFRREYDRLGQIGLASGVLQATRANYATHIFGDKAPFLERLFGGRVTYGTSENTPYALHRKFETLAEAEKAGFKPLSKNAAFVFATYANSLMSAVENARLIRTVEESKTASGDPYVMSLKEAPPSYVRINNPQMMGKAVHPEIASQMKFIFENPSATGIPAMMEVVADVTKRSAVSASLFHAKALADVHVAATPARARHFGTAAVGAGAGAALSALADPEHMGRDVALGALGGFVGPRMAGFGRGTSEFIKELHKGSNSDYIKRATDAGLTFGVDKGGLVVDDAGRRFYDAMKSVQDLADHITAPVGIKGGKAVGAYIKANHFMDEMMWGRLHAGMKLETWGKTAEILRENSIKRNARNPNERILSREEAESIAADYTNDMYGGLNWTKLAMDAKSPIGRVVAQSLFSPKGRRGMRIALFAPDWTLSTARAALSAIDKDLVNPLKWGRMAQGMFQPITRGDLARQYVARSALYYLVVGDAINYSMSGHHLWENDPKIGWSFIDWGDGRRMQFSKHIMETPHWFEKPVRQGVAKLGYVPKEIASQALGVEYLAPTESKGGRVFAGPQMEDRSLLGRAGHAAGGLMPIPFQAGDPESFLWGFAGMPLYGMTEEQKRDAKEKRAEKRRRQKESER